MHILLLYGKSVAENFQLTNLAISYSILISTALSELFYVINKKCNCTCIVVICIMVVHNASKDKTRYSVRKFSSYHAKYYAQLSFPFDLLNIHWKINDLYQRITQSFQQTTPTRLSQCITCLCSSLALKTSSRCFTCIVMQVLWYIVRSQHVVGICPITLNTTCSKVELSSASARIRTHISCTPFLAGLRLARKKKTGATPFTYVAILS